MGYSKKQKLFFQPRHGCYIVDSRANLIKFPRQLTHTSIHTQRKLPYIQVLWRVDVDPGVLQLNTSQCICQLWEKVGDRFVWYVPICTCEALNFICLGDFHWCSCCIKFPRQLTHTSIHTQRKLPYIQVLWRVDVVPGVLQLNTSQCICQLWEKVGDGFVWYVPICTCEALNFICLGDFHWCSCCICTGSTIIVI